MVAPPNQFQASTATKSIGPIDGFWVSMRPFSSGGGAASDPAVLEPYQALTGHIRRCLLQALRDIQADFPGKFKIGPITSANLLDFWRAKQARLRQEVRLTGGLQINQVDPQK